MYFILLDRPSSRIQAGMKSLARNSYQFPVLLDSIAQREAVPAVLKDTQMPLKLMPAQHCGLHKKCHASYFISR